MKTIKISQLKSFCKAQFPNLQAVRIKSRHALKPKTF